MKNIISSKQLNGYRKRYVPLLLIYNKTGPDFIINPFTRTVSHKTGNIIQLTAKEFDLLYFLISHKEQVFTKEQIYENVWGYDYPADPNNLTSFIRKLRKKIEPEPDRPLLYRHCQRCGYKYTENEEMVGKTAIILLELVQTWWRS